jgi:hypothetical protein
LLQPADYARMRQRIDKLANRAVFEIPEVLNHILKAWPRRDPLFGSALPDAALV